MGDRHGGRFARRGRALNPPRPQVDTHRGVRFRWRGVVVRICPRARTLSSAKASRHGARAKGFAPRRNAPHGEGLPTRRSGERICPARERSPRRRPTDTAHGRKELPRAGTLPSAKAYRHGARAKGFARAGTLSSAKASRHGARAKGFAPRRIAPLGEGLPTRRTSKRICPAQERSPRRKPSDTAHERKGLPRARTLPTAKASRHGARAKRFARAGTRPSAKASRHGARAKGLPRRGSRSPHVPTNGGPPSTDGQPEKHPFGGVAPERARPLPSSFTEKNKTTP